MCCSGAPAGAGQFSRASGPAAGGMKRYALRPLAATRPVAAAFVFFFLLPAPLKSWRTRSCQGCACAPSAARPALDIVPPGLHCVAFPGEAKRRSNRQPPLRLPGAGGEQNVPPAVFVGMLAVFAGGLACRGRGTQPGSKRPFERHSAAAGRGLGAPSPQRERQPTPALPGASVPCLHAQCLRPTSTDRAGPHTPTAAP